jgi:PKD repeat protein
LIHIAYSGVGTIELDAVGNIHSGIPGTEIIDHAPKTFYEDNNQIIPSSYSIQKNSYSILTGDYDNNKTIVIDPWVTDPDFIDQDVAFDIAGDADGNAYVFGGHSPFQVKKFNPSGNLVWTFYTSFIAWYGALAVNPAGNSIITEGCCAGGIMKLDSAGNVAWSLTNSIDEYWRLAYNGDFSKLYLATGYASTPGLQTESISLLDTATGAFSNSTSFWTTATEPRSLTVGLDGNIYTLSCTGGPGANEVMAMTPGFTTLFSVSSGYNLLYNGPPYANGSNTTSGQNGISAGNNFLCTSNGATLYKRDKNNGAVILSISIPGGSAENNSGILVDSCDNIYVGTSDAVIKYDSSLNVISTTATPGAVYCLYSGKNGELLVAGNGFIASMDLEVCNGTIPNQGGNMFFASNTDLCEKFCINFFDSSTNNPISWEWIFPGADSSSSTVQNPVNICYNVPGVYDVTLITTNPNGTDTLTLNNFITVYATPPSPTITQIGYTLTSSPANSYQWQLNTVDIPGATNQSYTISQSGLYTVIVGDITGCKNSASKDVLISGIDDVTNGANISIFPNPAGDEVTIQTSSIQNNEATIISITNILGKTVEQEKVKWKGQATLDVSNLPSGIYIVKVENEKEKLALKFVKE